MHIATGLQNFGLAAPWILGFSTNERARKATIAFSAIELGAVFLSKRDNQRG